MWCIELRWHVIWITQTVWIVLNNYDKMNSKCWTWWYLHPNDFHNLCFVLAYRPIHLGHQVDQSKLAFVAKIHWITIWIFFCKYLHFLPWIIPICFIVPSSTRWSAGMRWWCPPTEPSGIATIRILPSGSRGPSIWIMIWFGVTTSWKEIIVIVLLVVPHLPG